jgi:hypothetical protein
LIYPTEGGEPVASTQSLIIKLVENKTQGLGLHSATSIAKNIHHNTQVLSLSLSLPPLPSLALSLSLSLSISSFVGVLMTTHVADLSVWAKQVVRLLALCADQKNYVAESACQKILSFNACLSIANIPNLPNMTKVSQRHKTHHPPSVHMHINTNLRAHLFLPPYHTGCVSSFPRRSLSEHGS